MAGKVRILLLSFYFRPDLSAGSFRATALANALTEQGGNEVSVDVLTTRPNRYRTFTVEAPQEEVFGRIRVRRFALPPHRSGMMDQSRAFLNYAVQVNRALRGQRYDLVVATSSRLMTAVLGAMVANRLRVPLYLDIRDIFTDTMADLLEGRTLRHVMPLFRRLERFALRSADKINIVSGGFENHFRNVVPGKCFSIFTNGIDEEFLEHSYDRLTPNPRPLILYAGNIGQGQGLHRVVPEAARHLEGEADILIVGDGGATSALEQALKRSGAGNVELRKPVARPELISLYRQADVLFLHLNDHAAFRKVLPSKIFEYGATGKPILAGVNGYAREFIAQNLANASVFDPCDPDGMVSGFRSLRLSPAPREQFVRRFARGNIMAAMAQDVLGLLSNTRGKEKAS